MNPLKRAITGIQEQLNYTNNCINWTTRILNKSTVKCVVKKEIGSFTDNSLMGGSKGYTVIFIISLLSLMFHEPVRNALFHTRPLFHLLLSVV